MARLKEHYISTELDFVYITKDGKRFISTEEALKHQEKLINEIKSGKGD